MFIYGSASDSTLAAPDTIMDFGTGSDHIAFRAILGSLSVMPSDFGNATTLAARTIGWHSNGTYTTIYANLGAAAESLATGTDMMKIVAQNDTGMTSGNFITQY